MHAKLFFITFILFAALGPALAACGRTAHEPERITVHLCAPQSQYIQDFDTNLYKLWLEEQTGLNIEMTWLPPDDAEAIVRRQLLSGEDLPDAYVGFGNTELFSLSNIESYGTSGVIIPLNDLIKEFGVHTQALWQELPEFNIKQNMTATDGNIYFLPGFSSSVITRYRQIMWVNVGWLDELSLPVPETTDEFADMLRAFRDSDPGRIPMAGTSAHYSKQPYDFLLNAFIYNDIRNARMFLENGRVRFAPITDEWREALKYMHGLYAEGLYSPLSFSQDNQQFNQMANDSLDILGAFLSPGITLTVLQNSPEVLARYAGIAPLSGPEGVRLTTVFSPIARANGMITKAAKHPQELFLLFDLMLSEEASLMGRYGEWGVDWDFAGPAEVSIYGTPATVHIINQIWNTPQNKHLAQIVPYVSRPKYSGGVTWDGNTTDGEYINAQAAMLHGDFEPDEYLAILIFSPDEEARIAPIRAGIEAYVDKALADFITGGRDIYDDGDWAAYLGAFDDLGLDTLLSTAQTAYDRDRY